MGSIGTVCEPFDGPRATRECKLLLNLAVFDIGRIWRPCGLFVNHLGGQKQPQSIPKAQDIQPKSNLKLWVGFLFTHLKIWVVLG